MMHLVFMKPFVLISNDVDDVNERLRENKFLFFFDECNYPLASI